MSTNNNLCRIMSEQGVSVRELQRRTNLSISSIRRLRRDHMVGNLYTWELVTSALGVSVDDILGGEDDGRETGV